MLDVAIVPDPSALAESLPVQVKSQRDVPLGERSAGRVSPGSVRLSALT